MTNGRYAFWLGVLLLTAAYLAIALSQISALPLLDPDEPRYASAGRTMARGGSLLVPEFNGEPRINKPPLFYWLAALSDKLAGGATEFSSRLPSVVMGLLMLWGTIWLGSRVFGAATGLLGGLVLAATPLFMALSRCCITDMTFSTFLAGSLAWLMLGMLGFSSRNKAGWIASIFLGLAVLTKATPALAITLVVTILRAMALPQGQRPAAARWIPWLLLAALLLSAGALQCDYMSKRAHSKAVAEIQAAALDSGDEGEQPAPHRNVWSFADSVLNKAALALAFGVVVLLLVMAIRAERLSPALPPMWKAGFALALSMGLWWYALLILDEGWAKFYALIKFELSGRIAGVMHREGFYYYLYMLPAVIFPWSPGLLSAMKTANQDAAEKSNPGSRADAFLLAWLLGIVFFFSIPGAKLSTYILPAMPAVALLMARFLRKLSSVDSSPKPAWVGLTQILTVAMALALLLFPIYGRWLPKDIPLFMEENSSLTWVLSGGSAILFPGAWLLATRGKTSLGAAGLSCGIMLLVLLALPSLTEKLRHRSTKDVCEQVRDSIADCVRVESLGVSTESLSYYLDRRIGEQHWKPPASDGKRIDLLFRILDDKEPVALFVDKRFYPRLFGKDRDLRKLKPAEVQQDLPDGLKYVFSNQSVLVVRNEVKK